MTILPDLRAALRLWRRRPGVPALAVLFLASGMGMAGGIFAVADAALWRSLPLPAADRVVWVQSVDRGVAGDTSPGVFAAWSSRVRTLSDVGALRPVAATLRDARGAERLDGAQATAGRVPRPRRHRRAGPAAHRGRRTRPARIRCWCSPIGCGNRGLAVTRPSSDARWTSTDAAAASSACSRPTPTSCRSAATGSRRCRCRPTRCRPQAPAT